MIRISQLKLNIVQDEADLLPAAAKKLGVRKEDISDISIIRKSLDARKKESIKYVYTVDVSTPKEASLLKRLKNDPDIQKAEPSVYVLPDQGTEHMKNRPCIIGAGPAGLFCAYFLAEAGYRPVLIEQGEPVDQRRKTADDFLNGKTALDLLSNIQFGEGGAGAFSDGKLMSAIKDINGRKSEVLRIFAEHGAPGSIVYTAKPHVGTDVICRVVKSMRETIIANGGTVLFSSRLTDIKITEGRVCAITVSHGGITEDMACDILVLAIGHSSRDTMKMLYEKGLKMEAKSFAVGVRVQHLQESINCSQYGMDHKKLYRDLLPAADYKLTAKAGDGRAVYSFCMCPGGYVINSSSEPEMLCINGMSYSGRKGENANSAIIVSVTPEDTGACDDPLAAIEFQRSIERKAYKAGNGSIPVQRLEDFRLGRKTQDFGIVQPQMKGLATPADINGILPGFICNDIKEAMEIFGKQISGFDDPDTIISAPETRTSSPVRIVRDGSFQSVSAFGIYPCGEGAGYAGGITSSAVDGIKVFEEIFKTFRPC